MKHISESIIGRKGSHSALPKIQQWDIVRTRDGMYRLCIVDEDLIRMIPRYGNYGYTGLLISYFRKQDSSSSIIEISKYDKNLEYTGSYLGTRDRNTMWDIVEIYRPSDNVVKNIKPKTKQEFIDLAQNTSLFNIVKKFKLIYKLIYKR